MEKLNSHLSAAHKSFNRFKYFGLSLALLLGSLECAHAQTDNTFLWTKFTEIAVNARSREDFGMSEKMYQEALERAEGFGERDSRLIGSIVNLAAIYAEQGKLSFAEPLYKRLMRIAEKTPSFSSQIAPSISQYCQLLRANNRLQQAKETEAVGERLRNVKPADVDCQR